MVTEVEMRTRVSTFPFLACLIKIKLSLLRGTNERRQLEDTTIMGGIEVAELMIEANIETPVCNRV